MHGLPPMYYPYSNGYFFGQGNPHQLHPGLYQSSVHSTQMVDLDKQNSGSNDQPKTNKKQRQKSEDSSSNQKKSAIPSKDSNQEKTTSKKLDSNDDKLKDDDTSKE